MGAFAEFKQTFPENDRARGEEFAPRDKGPQPLSQSMSQNRGGAILSFASTAIKKTLMLLEQHRIREADLVERADIQWTFFTGGKYPAGARSVKVTEKTKGKKFA